MVVWLDTIILHVNTRSNVKIKKDHYPKSFGTGFHHSLFLEFIFWCCVQIIKLFIGSSI